MKFKKINVLLDPKKSTFLINFISIFFASLMILFSIFSSGTEYAKYNLGVTVILIGMWIIPFFYVVNIQNSK